MTETAKYRHSYFPSMDISYSAEITKKVSYLLNLLQSSKNPILELPNAIWCGLTA